MRTHIEHLKYEAQAVVEGRALFLPFVAAVVGQIPIHEKNMLLLEAAEISIRTYLYENFWKKYEKEV